MIRLKTLKHCKALIVCVVFPLLMGCSGANALKAANMAVSLFDKIDTANSSNVSDYAVLTKAILNLIQASQHNTPLAFSNLTVRSAKPWVPPLIFFVTRNMSPATSSHPF